MTETYTTTELIDLVNRLRKELETARADAAREFMKKFERKIKDVQFTLGQTFEIQSALRDVSKEMAGESAGL